MAAPIASPFAQDGNGIERLSNTKAANASGNTTSSAPAKSWPSNAMRSNEIWMEFFRNILRNYSVYSAWLPRRDPVKAESCRSLYPQTSPRASQKGRLLDSDGKREKQSIPWCMVRSEFFPLEFWLPADAFESLTVNSAGDLPHSERCFCPRRNVSNAVQQKVSQTTLAAKAPRTSLRKCAPR